jgi:hypothetical protein
MAKVHPTKTRKPVEDKPLVTNQPKFVPVKTLREIIASGFVLPTVEGKPRPDGRPWSEVEPWENLPAIETPS